MKFTELANFQDKQLQAWFMLMDPQTKYLLFGGAAGGGKSYLLRWSAIGLCMYYYKKYGIVGVPIGLFSEDYPTLRDRQITKIAREVPAWLGVVKETQIDGLGLYLTPEYGSGKVLLRNLDDPSKYSSVEFAAILVEELTKNPYETFEDLRNRMRFPGVEDRKFMAATNPGEIGHVWVKGLFVTPDLENPDIEQDRFKFLQSLVMDNKYNPKDYILQLQAIRDPQKRKALLEGDWNQFKGQYFASWREHLHVISPFVPRKDYLIIGGMDWGRTAPFSFHLAELSKVTMESGIKFYRVKVFYEAYGTDKRPVDWSDKITREIKGFNISLNNVSFVQGDTKMFDPQDDGSVSIRDQFVKADEGWRCLKPANKDRIGGWENMQNWFSIAPDGFPYYQAGSNCVKLIETIPGLVRDDIKVEDVNTKGEDHAGDEQRYMLKKLKWIDAGPVGAIIHPAPNQQKMKIAPQFIGEKQLGINLDIFATPNMINERGVGGIRRA